LTTEGFDNNVFKNFAYVGTVAYVGQRSGRVDEEIVMFHQKLKQIEDGLILWKMSLENY